MNIRIAFRLSSRVQYLEIETSIKDDGKILISRRIDCNGDVDNNKKMERLCQEDQKSQ